MSKTTKDLEHRTERFVRINDRFAVTREKRPDVHCWILREFYTGYKRGKTADEKIPTRKVKQTYYATLEQACMMVIEKSADGETAQAMIDAINEAKKEIVAAIIRHEFIATAPEMYEAIEEVIRKCDQFKNNGANANDYRHVQSIAETARAALTKYREMSR